jgi:hypothetical protein
MSATGDRSGSGLFVKACQADGIKTDVLNAWLRREEERARAMGHDIRKSMRFAADGGLVAVPME